jgi:hypothetical protein
LWNEPLVYTQGRNADIAILDLEKQEAYIRTHSGRSDNTTSSDTTNTTTTTTSSSSSSPAKLVFAKAYGFRNIQSVLLKQKSGKNEYDFVEIMACPSGCLNGGGQLKKATATTGAAKAATAAVSGADIDADAGASFSARETPAETRERVSAADALFHDIATPLRRCEDAPLVQYLYQNYSDTHSHSNSSQSATSDACRTNGISSSVGLGTPFSEKAAALLHTRYHAVPKLELVAPLATKW